MHAVHHKKTEIVEPSCPYGTGDHHLLGSARLLFAPLEDGHALVGQVASGLVQFPLEIDIFLGTESMRAPGPYGM